MKKKVVDISELKEGEYHPSADYAMRWYRNYQMTSPHYVMMRESLSSTALSGNRLAQIVSGTLQRLDDGKPVSDRYVLGAMWFLREAEDKI